ncbi:NTE family protein [Tangfeifania diversioriginum]|uniref:NTE family protein n=1 Tax=Tangfeifania diversioriginum TaxID=1168035 RepID=A0A1M6MVL6_9BACT|nr:patatin-like phospholipase family protein [Tangfeifania diversioriginum]SHJ87497.1 NTE family protein [Tangfeifania diversioriginum]
MNLTTYKKEIPKFGIALSGGGARGIAHIGVLEALEKYGIKPGVVSGTSMGAIVGAFYAAGYPPNDLLKIMLERKFHRMVNWHMPFSGLIDMRKVKAAMREIIGEDDFSSLEIPFYCAVTNLNSGLEEIKSEGELFQWVVASSSIPVVFEPPVINGQTYVDGGLLNNLPAEAIRDKCQVLIGVHVNHNGPEEKIKGLKTIAERAFRLGISQNVETSKQICDFVIEPPEARNYSTFAFGKAEEIYQVGYDETEKQILRLFESINLERVMELKKNS